MKAAYSHVAIHTTHSLLETDLQPMYLSVQRYTVLYIHILDLSTAAYLCMQACNGGTHMRTDD